MWFANGSVWPQHVNKALSTVAESLLFSSSSSFMCCITSLLYPGSTFALSSCFCSLRCIDNFQQKCDFSLFYRAKNLIADSSIQLCFTGVKNNKQGGGLLFQTLNMRLLFKRDLMRLQEAIDDNYIRTWLFLCERFDSSGLCIGPKLKCGNAWDDLSCCHRVRGCLKSTGGHETIADVWGTTYFFKSHILVPLFNIKM